MRIFHRTSPQAALEIIRTHHWKSKEHPPYIYFSNFSVGQADGYGKSTISIDLPKKYLELDDEFPSGELHFRALASDVNLHAQNYELISPNPKENFDLCKQTLDLLIDREYLYQYKQVSEVLQGRFAFVHFTQKHRLKQIESLGFKGRRSRDIHDFRILSPIDDLSEDGYIFAYRAEGNTPEEAQRNLRLDLEDYMDEEGPYVLMLSSAIFGIAWGGIAVQRDSEEQLIIPIACIDHSSLQFVTDLDKDYPFIWADDEDDED
jgi:hypothetical protein